MLKFLKSVSDLGGGSELLALFSITFLVGSRPKAIYFMTTLAIDKVLIGLLKIAYKEPRPYLKFFDIEPLSCSKEYGNPSGHSSAAFATSIVLFLDLFHGESLLTIIGKHDPVKSISKYFRSKYLIGGLIALFWMLIIPISRVALGAHSIDQVIYGSLLGLWNGLTCHFLLRDQVMLHVWLINLKVRHYIGFNNSSNALFHDKAGYIEPKPKHTG